MNNQFPTLTEMGIAEMFRLLSKRDAGRRLTEDEAVDLRVMEYLYSIGAVDES